MGDGGGFDQALGKVGRVLLWCFILAMVPLVLWFGMIVLAPELVYKLHCLLMPAITREQFALVHYVGIATLKIAAISLFLIPCAAIWIVLRKKGG